MKLTKDERHELCTTHQRSEGDTGSPEVQVALLSQRISNITDHLKGNKKDHASRRGLRLLVGRRSKLLRYLSRKDFGRYKDLISTLGLRR